MLNKWFKEEKLNKYFLLNIQFIISFFFLYDFILSKYKILRTQRKNATTISTKNETTYKQVYCKFM